MNLSLGRRWCRGLGSGRARSRRRIPFRSVTWRPRPSAEALLIAAGAVWVNRTSTRSGTGTSAPPQASNSRTASRPSTAILGKFRHGTPPNPSGWRTQRELRDTDPSSQPQAGGSTTAHRASSHGAATVKRRKLSETRYAEVLSGKEAIDGLLRRKTVKPATRQLYTRIAEDFLLSRQLTLHSPPNEIDHLLDEAIVQLYLAGESEIESNYLFYAVRWYCCRSNADFRLAYRSRAGHSRARQKQRRLPETWEAVLLQCHSLLTTVTGAIPLHEAALACTGYLLSFDLYARAFDLTNAKRAELRPPQGAAARGAASAWTLTVWPSTSHETSKTHQHDHTRVIGGTDPKRVWLTELCRPLLRATMGQTSLLGISETKYTTLFSSGAEERPVATVVSPSPAAWRRLRRRALAARYGLGLAAPWKLEFHKIGDDVQAACEVSAGARASHAGTEGVGSSARSQFEASLDYSFEAPGRATLPAPPGLSAHIPDPYEVSFVDLDLCHSVSSFRLNNNTKGKFGIVAKLPPCQGCASLRVPLAVLGHDTASRQHARSASDCDEGK